MRIVTNLCAYQKPDTQADSEACSKVVFGPDVLHHVFDDAPVYCPLLFLRDGLFGKDYAMRGYRRRCRLRRLLLLRALRLDELSRGMFGLGGILMADWYPSIGFSVQGSGRKYSSGVS